MKFSLLLVCLLLSALFGVSQVAINTDGSLPNPNAILDLKSGTQGILFPRTDSVSRKAIPNIEGMIIFDTTTHSPWYNTGATWVSLANTGSLGWLTTGNAGTVDGTNFIGTTDNTALDFRVNNQPSGKIDPINQNTFLGYQSGVNSAYSTQNTAYGSQSLFTNTFGVSNLAFGWEALYSNTYGNFNVAVGNQSLYSNTQGEQNVAVGPNALRSNLTASNNSAFGYNALSNNTTGGGNTAIGYSSLGLNTIGSNNVAIGFTSLNLNSTGIGNVAIGDSALYSNSTNYNTAVGYLSLQANTRGIGNTAIGSGSLEANTTGIQNTAIGAKALYSNTTGTDNTANGYGALNSNTTGGANSAFGLNALNSNTTGFANSAFGISALGSNVSGFSLTAIGDLTDVLADGLVNATVIGYNAKVGSSNTIQLGDGQVTAVNSYGTFTTISDGRFKFNVQEDVSGLNFILKLRPVTYQLNTRKIQNSLGADNQASFASTNDNEIHSMSIRRTGFIAQEVEKAADESGFNFDAIKKPENDKDHYSLSYEEFVVPLVKAVQEQQKQINDLKKEIEDLKKMVAEFSKK